MDPSTVPVPAGSKSAGSRTVGSRLGRAALVAIPAAFLGYFFVYPLVSITIRGLTVDGSIDLGIVGRVLGDPTLQRIAWFTLWQATVSTLLTVIIAMPAAWVFARFDFRGKRVLKAITLIPFVLPTLVVATAFLALIGPRGVSGVDLTGTVWIILIAHVFYNYAIVVRGVGAYWERIDPDIERAARTLGASPLTVFRTVTLPLLRPAIASTSALIFLFSFTSFGVVLLLGDLTYTTIEVEIWRQATAFLRLDIASTLAVLQLIGVGVVLILYGRYQRRTAVVFHHDVVRPPKPETRRDKILVSGIVASMVAIVGIPIAVLVWKSFVEPTGGLGFGNYSSLASLPAQSAAFVDPIEAIANSLRFATIAGLIALFIGVLASAALTYSSRRVSSLFDIFVMLPLGTSAVTIGFGFLVALDWPVDLRASLILIPIAHALVAIPFVVRTTTPTLGSIQRQLRDAAATLGASPWRAWWSVEFKLVGRAILVGGAFAFAISMGEFGATAFIARPGAPTMPIAIFKLLGRPGGSPFGAALAMSVILMVVTAAAILIIDSIRPEQQGDL
ncbi:MAG: iron ABC transporter permease [Armatimonadetes bacterium]|nr:MAG: iron ABC transporter permease [Armatimonadota bacterium]